MNSGSLTPSVLQAQRALKTAGPNQVIAFSHPGPYEFPDKDQTILNLRQGKARVFFCHSPLHFRELLLKAGCGKGPTIIVTSLDEQSLGRDVVAVLGSHKFRIVEMWPAVKDKFRVRSMVPSLSNEAWIARALLQLPEKKLNKNLMTWDMAWELLVKYYLRVTDLPDAMSLLNLSHNHDKMGHYFQAPLPFRRGMAQWLGERGEPITRLMACLLNTPHVEDLLPLGLACEVLVCIPVEENGSVYHRGFAKLEVLLGDVGIDRILLKQWASAAGTVMDQLQYAVESVSPDPRLQKYRDRAERLLKELEIVDFAYYSHHLPLGFEQRLNAFAGMLNKALEGKTSLQPAEIQAQLIGKHKMKEEYKARILRMRMAMRLLRYLRTKEVKARSFAEGVTGYYNQGGSVDWARRILRNGDENAAATRAYKNLMEQVFQRRERENRVFGQMAAAWSRGPGESSDFILIENLLKQVAVPLLRKKRNILLLVLDGMSVDAFREFMSSVTQMGWTAHAEGDKRESPPVVAAFPTRTDISRSSLFHGELVSGNAEKEARAFRDHLLLQNLCKDHPPLLWHKAGLRDESGLDEEVLKKVVGEEHPVLAAVINSIDDHLAKGDQIQVNWNLETLSLASQFLSAAAQGERMVILTADHGHVLEAGSQQKKYDGVQARARSASNEPGEGEVLMEGPRVLGHGGRCIMPWTEQLRYTSKSHGYHGGVSPQEVVIPLAVLQRGERPISGWMEVGEYQPEWWTAAPGKAVAGKKHMKPRVKKLAETAQIGLFPEEAKSLTDQLLGTRIFKTQQEKNQRGALDQDRIESFLRAMESRDFTITLEALAPEANIPHSRMSGVISKMRRLLNLDGYEILVQEEDSLKINKQLLKTQFGL